MTSSQRQSFGFLLSIGGAFIVTGSTIQAFAEDYGDTWLRATILASIAGVAALVVTLGVLMSTAGDDEYTAAGVLSLVLAAAVGLYCTAITAAAAVASAFDLGDAVGFVSGQNRGGSVATHLGWLAVSVAAVGVAVAGFARLRPATPTEPFIGELDDP
jgi:hypothetical protein